MTEDGKYDCYERVGLDMPRDRPYCERLFLDSNDAKYDCLDRLSLPKLGDYCEGKYSFQSQWEEKYECLANEGVPRTAVYCHDKFSKKREEAGLNQTIYDPAEEIACITQLPDMPKLYIDCIMRNDLGADLFST